MGLAGVRRLRLPGDAQHLRDPPGRGPGDADAERLLRRRQRNQRPDRQHVRLLHRQPRRLHARHVGPNCTSDCSRVGGLPNGFQGGNAGRGLRRARHGDVGRRLHAERGGRERRHAAVGLQPVARAHPLPGAALRDARLRPGPDRDVHQPRRRRRRPDRHRAAARSARDGQLGTKYGDAAIVEKYSEEGATLLKNDDHALPLTSADLAGGILVTGVERQPHGRRPDQRGVDRLHRSRRGQPAPAARGFSGKPGAFTFVPGERPHRPAGARSSTRLSPTGEPRPPPATCDATSGLQRSSGATTAHSQRPGRPEGRLHGRVAGRPARAAAATRWSGYVYVPTADTYTFELQQSATVPNANVTFALDNAASAATGAPVTHTRANAPNIYGATTPGTPTNAGYTEALLTNRHVRRAPGNDCAAARPSAATRSRSHSTTRHTTPASFRFAFSRVQRRHRGRGGGRRRQEQGDRLRQHRQRHEHPPPRRRNTV